MAAFWRKPQDISAKAIKEVRASTESLNRQLISASRAVLRQARVLQTTSEASGIRSDATRHEAALLAALETEMTQIQTLIARNTRMISLVRRTTATTIGNKSIIAAASATSQLKELSKISHKTINELSTAAECSDDIADGTATTQIAQEATALQENLYKGDESAALHSNAVDAIIHRLATKTLQKMPMPPTTHELPMQHQGIADDADANIEGAI